MGQPRIHHYVPKLYQRGFALKTGRRAWQVAVTDRDSGKTETRNIEKVFAKPHWNSLLDEQGTKDAEVEVILAEEIDGPAAPGIHALRDGELPVGRAREPVAMFMAAQLSRGTAVRENLRSFVADIGRKSLSLSAQNFSDAQWMEVTGEIPSEEVKARLVDSEDHIDIRPTNAALLPALFSTIEPLAEVLLKRIWTLVELEESGFFTGEHPVVHVNSAPGRMNYGAATAEKIHFPVSPARALVMSLPKDGWEGGVARGSLETAERLNWATFTHPSNRQLLSHPEVRSHPLPGIVRVVNSWHWPWWAAAEIRSLTGGR